MRIVGALIASLMVFEVLLLVIFTVTCGRCCSVCSGAFPTAIFIVQLQYVSMHDVQNQMVSLD